MKDKPVPTSIRVTAELKKKIEEKAKKENRSVNNMIVRILELAVE